jgi:hypothetical protein
MLRGLLRWGREGLRRHAGVSCRVGLSLRGTGSEITDTPFSLPIPNILCQNSQMKRLLILPVLFLTLVVGTPSFSADFRNCERKYKNKNYHTAIRLCSHFAEQGDADAQNNLGGMYGMGKGVIQDNVYAHMWLNIAASSGNKVAVKNRDIVAKRMPPAQIAEAQKLARECVRKKYKGC